jgi:putative hydrolase of the HAD superfamily
MIRAVFFDLDGTLYDRDAAILQLAEHQFDELSSDFPHVERKLFIEKLVLLDGHGHDRTPRLHHALAKVLGFSDSVADRLEDYFRSHYPKFCALTDDTRTTLETLKSRGLKMGIITNGPTLWQSRKIECLGIAPLFDTILISGSEGIEKPDPRIFARAVENCGVEAKESIFVGDHPEIDIQGARAAGLLLVWKRMPYWNVPEDVPRIDRLSEILRLSYLRIG